MRKVKIKKEWGGEEGEKQKRKERGRRERGKRVKAWREKGGRGRRKGVRRMWKENEG